MGTSQWEVEFNYFHDEYEGEGQKGLVLSMRNLYKNDFKLKFQLSLYYLLYPSLGLNWRKWWVKKWWKLVYCLAI